MKPEGRLHCRPVVAWRRSGVVLVLAGLGCAAAFGQGAAVNKCTMAGRVTYQTEPCPRQATQKTVDTSDKNKALGRDLAEQARRDKAALAAREAEAARRAARERAAEQGLAVGDSPSARPPGPRNLAIERMEQSAARLLPKASAPAGPSPSK